MSLIRDKKNVIRKKYKALRCAIPSGTKEEYDKAICRRFLDLASYRFSEILLLYAPLYDEIDIGDIIKHALKQGKRIAFPRCNEKDHTMTFHFVNDLSELEVGTMGIMEPTEASEKYDISTSETISAICFVPALVYDKSGYRLGYGKGYYDRYLSAFKGTKIGLIYSDFILDSVPRGKFDLSVDILVTEKGVRPTNAN